jgi:hypothetical protein
MSSASIFRRSTNQPAAPNRRACAKQEDILLMQDTTIWRTTGPFLGIPKLKCKIAANVQKIGESGSVKRDDARMFT